MAPGSIWAVPSGCTAEPRLLPAAAHGYGAARRPASTLFESE
jgi:hypothetical protein